MPCVEGRLLFYGLCELFWAEGRTLGLRSLFCRFALYCCYFLFVSICVVVGVGLGGLGVGVGVVGESVLGVVVDEVLGLLFLLAAF